MSYHAKTSNLVDQIVAKDYTQANETLKDILVRKSLDAIDEKRIGVAKSFFKEGTVNESHFSVGDDVECIESGMTGTVVEVDPDGVGKYYTVKREDGKLMKYAPDELEMNESIDEGAFKGLGKMAMKRKLKKSIKQDQDDMDFEMDDIYGGDEDKWVKRYDARKRKELALKRLSRESIDEEYSVYYKGKVFDSGFETKEDAMDSIDGMDLSDSEKKDYRVRKSPKKKK